MTSSSHEPEVPRVWFLNGASFRMRSELARRHSQRGRGLLRCHAQAGCLALCETSGPREPELGLQLPRDCPGRMQDRSRTVRNHQQSKPASAWVIHRKRDSIDIYRNSCARRHNTSRSPGRFSLRGGKTGRRPHHPLRADGSSSRYDLGRGRIQAGGGGNSERNHCSRGGRHWLGARGRRALMARCTRRRRGHPRRLIQRRAQIARPAHAEPLPGVDGSSVAGPISAWHAHRNRGRSPRLGVVH